MKNEKVICMACENHGHRLCTGKFTDENGVEITCECGCTNRKLKALDLFCKAGGASSGIYQTGLFDVTGVDIEPQKNYPFRFIQADALTFDLSGYDFIWASPPCQFASELTPIEFRSNHPNLIPQIRARLNATGKPYIIENVEGARFHLINPVKLCGSMFGLPIYRHRYFESNAFPFFFLPPCNHSFYPVVVSGQSNRIVAGKRQREFNAAECREALGVEHFISRDETSEAIPPAYSKFLVEQIFNL